MRLPLVPSPGPQRCAPVIAAGATVEHLKRIDDAWRASFRPHAVLTTRHETPSQIFVATLRGAEKKLYIDPPDHLPKPGWPAHAARPHPSGMPGFGGVTGFVINYTPDRAVRFDRAGNTVEELDSAYRRGSLWMRGISAAAIGTLE